MSMLCQGKSRAYKDKIVDDYAQRSAWILLWGCTPPSIPVREFAFCPFRPGVQKSHLCTSDAGSAPRSFDGANSCTSRHSLKSSDPQCTHSSPALQQLRPRRPLFRSVPLVSGLGWRSGCWLPCLSLSGQEQWHSR